ncbi:MAG: DUF6570 domain-containing protein [Sedimenticola sp.]
MYKSSVCLLTEGKYTNISRSMVHAILAHRLKSALGKEWICKTCHLTIKRGKMPAQAKANNLTLSEQPSELKGLNNLELRLISQRIPFMKMVGLPRGKQHGIHGPAVNVPAKLDVVCRQFPRLPSESQLVPLKFKRRMKYKSHYMYDYVRPQKVLAALRWLKTNNTHYKKVTINDNWSNDAASNDPELWGALTNTPSETEPSMMVVDVASSAIEPSMMVVDVPTFETRPNISVIVPTSETEPNVSDCFPTSEIEPSISLVVPTSETEPNLRVVDVPRDGHCLFSSVCYQLDRLGICSITYTSLRKELAAFMTSHPTNYKDFVCDHIASNDLYNADTEQPTKADHIIAEIEDVQTQQAIKWQMYLDNLWSGRQWGEHIAIQAISDMYSVTIHVHTTGNPVQSACPRFEAKHEFHLQLLQQFHYVALEPYSVDDHAITVAPQTLNNDGDSAATNTRDALSSDCNNTDTVSLDDKMAAEDEAAFEESSAICGLPFETHMVLDNPDMSLADKLISIAPAEFERPKPLLSDPYFEELANLTNIQMV